MVSRAGEVDPTITRPNEIGESKSTQHARLHLSTSPL